MKKNYLFLIAASVALAFTACSTKELDLPEEKESGVAEEMKHVNLSATTENDNNTKVTLVGTTYGWSEGVDKLMVTTSNDGGSSYILTESSAFSDGHFTLDYAGRRDGYAVIPSTFLTGYDGSKLTITYPSSYDISSYITDSYLAGGKYDAAGAYLPIPMIATSTEGDDNLKFYALGALVRVTVSDVPVGTKKLFITFNQTVTGNFTVTSPTPGTNSVAVADASTPSTVEFTISAGGITSAQAANSFVLYIPVPTTTVLGIASSSKTKATVARNNGYAWAVPAITCKGDGSINTSIGKYEIAPGNLLAKKQGVTIEYSFLSGLNQLVSTRGISLTGNRHDSAHNEERPVSDLNDLVDGHYQDVFTWAQMSELVGNTYIPTKSYWTEGSEPPTIYNFSPNDFDKIPGQHWKVPSTEIMKAICNVEASPGTAPNPNYYRNGDKAIIGSFKGVSCARVLVDVSTSLTYASQAMWKGATDEITTVGGLLIFPDGYVDQTGFLNVVDGERMFWSVHDWGTTVSSIADRRTRFLITFDAFSKMIAKGAIFLPAVGLDAGGWVYEGVGNTTITGYYLSDSAYKNSNTKYDYAFRGMNIAKGSLVMAGGRDPFYYCSVRLVREVVADGPSSSGEDRGAWGNLD